MQKKIIVIHSKVAYGYVGSNATSLIFQLAGYDVITVPTILLSNRYGLPTVGGGLVPIDVFEGIIEGILKLNILEEVSTIVTGYMGSSEQVQIVGRFIQKIKSTHPEIVYVCDPVMGDKPQGLYVNKEVPNAIVEYLLPLADVLTPNQFEIETLLQQKISTEKQVLDAIEKHSVLKHKDMLVTGCRFENITGALQIIVKQRECYDRIETPYIPIDPPGTGELFAALVLLFKSSTYKPYSACAAIASILINKALDRMIEEGRREFDLSDILAVHQHFQLIY